MSMIITHLQLVRNPWRKPLENRVNSPLFEKTAAYLLGIQHGRELDEIEVIRINHILKCLARKFIAAGREEDLYRERRLRRQDWARLDDDWFLLPNLWKVHFSGS